MIYILSVLSFKCHGSTKLARFEARFEQSRVKMHLIASCPSRGVSLLYFINDIKDDGIFNCYFIFFIFFILYSLFFILFNYIFTQDCFLENAFMMIDSNANTRL